RLRDDWLWLWLSGNRFRLDSGRLRLDSGRLRLDSDRLRLDSDRLRLDSDRLGLEDAHRLGFGCCNRLGLRLRDDGLPLPRQLLWDGRAARHRQGHLGPPARLLELDDATGLLGLPFDLRLRLGLG